jgi:hypothetical protein
VNPIEKILRLPVKPKEIQQALLNAIVEQKINIPEFIHYFESAKDVDKGTCADVMKHVTAADPGLLSPYTHILIKYINHKAPRVKWGVQEAIGNLAKQYPAETSKAIPFLLENTTETTANTTVVKWCAAFALTEIAKYDAGSREQLIPVFEKIVGEESNNGVRNVYLKTIKKLKK